MIKSKLMWRFWRANLIILLLFALLTGSLFGLFFRRHTLQLNRTQLQKQAIALADGLSSFLGNAENHTAGDTRPFGPGGPSGPGRSGQQGLPAYIRLLDDVTDANVWLIDPNRALFTGRRTPQPAINYQDLPQDATAVIARAFDGQTALSDGFSSLLGTQSVTVATPVLAEGSVAAVLLLHAPVSGLENAIQQGLVLLAVILLAALLLSIPLAALAANRLSRPIRKINAVAGHLAQGQYDVRSGVQSPDEIGELAATMDVLSQQLKQAEHARSQLEQQRRDFLATVSHELRTPVTVIRGSLEALRDHVASEPEQIARYHEQMLQDSIQLQRLVNDLLDLSRLENPDFKIEQEPLNPLDVLRDAVRSARQLAVQKEVEIKIDIEETPLPLVGDYGRLRQLLLILLDNAVKFSPPGGLITATADAAAIHIRDQGPGIPDAQLAQIFERFARGQDDPATGTGLGLSIARQIASRHQMRLTAANAETGGAVFTLHWSA